MDALMLLNKDVLRDFVCNMLNQIEFNLDVLKFGLDGVVPLEPRNPYSFLRVILAERGIHC